MSILEKPLTNAQLELLKMFGSDLSEADLLALRMMLANFFAERASDEMDRLWEERGWTDATMEGWVGGRVA